MIKSREVKSLLEILILKDFLVSFFRWGGRWSFVLFLFFTEEKKTNNSKSFNYNKHEKVGLFDIVYLMVLSLRL